MEKRERARTPLKTAQGRLHHGRHPPEAGNEGPHLRRPHVRRPFHLRLERQDRTQHSPCGYASRLSGGRQPHRIPQPGHARGIQAGRQNSRAFAPVHRKPGHYEEKAPGRRLYLRDGQGQQHHLGLEGLRALRRAEAPRRSQENHVQVPHLADDPHPGRQGGGLDAHELRLHPRPQPLV